MNNINYNEDILIYPVTNNLSDITNFDVTTNYAININVLSLIDGAGIAIFVNNKQIYKDYNNEIENKFIFNDYTNTDMTVYSYNIYNIYLEESSLIKTYLYNNKRKKISSTFQKNINIDYKVDLNLFGINLENKDSYILDGTIVPSNNSYDKIHIKNIKSLYNKDYYYTSHSNLTEIVTTDNTNLLYTLTQDSNKIFNVDNILTLQATDSNNNQISPKFKKRYFVERKNCQAPLITPIDNFYTTYYTQEADPSYDYIGEQEICCSFGYFMNLTVKPYNYDQRDQEYFSLYNNYSTEDSITLTYNTPLKIESYLSQGEEQNIDINGELDTTTVVIYNDFVPNKIYNNFSLIDYDNDSLFLQFKYNGIPDISTSTKKTNIRIKNNRTGDIGITYFNNYYNYKLYYYEDYTNREDFGEYNITGPNYSTTGYWYEQNKYNLKYNNQDSINNIVITSSSQKQKYLDARYYQYSDKLPIMMRVETNHKVNMRLSMIGANQYFPDNYTNLINTIIEPGIPFELKHSDNFYIDPEIYSNFLELYFDLIDTTTISQETAQDIEINVQLVPVRDNTFYILKDSINFQNNDTIKYFALCGQTYENPNYIYDISAINTVTLDNSKVTLNKPNLFFDKQNLDLSIEMMEYTDKNILSNMSLYFKVYQNDNTSLSDQTTVTDLNIGDIVHVFGFNINSEYIVECYSKSDNTNYYSSEIEKFIIKTPSGVCSVPIVVRDNEQGHQTLTCGANCHPSYTYVTSYFPDGNTMHNILYQDRLNISAGEPNEVLGVHPYTNRPCNIFMDSTTVEVCLEPYAIRYGTELAGVFFAFSCISDDLSYASAEVIESENYPNNAMVPVGSLYYYYAGSTSQKQYEQNYARGSAGSYSSEQQHNKNDTGQVKKGTSSYYYITMAIGDKIEVMQKDYYSNYAHSQSITKKRQA